MPVYLLDDIGPKEREKRRREAKCKVCGGWVNCFLDNDPASPHKGEVFLACNDWHRTHHEGIMREATKVQQEGVAGMNIESRREFMNQQFGKETTTALEKYQGMTSLSKNDAMVILESIWPNAPVAEKVRAALLCASYHLNPLMKHVYLIPFNKGKQNESWATVMGIGATRLLASRSGSFSYTDDTPRLMTEEEQKKIFGESYPTRLYVIVKVKDPKTGAEAPGYGWWPKDQLAYGSDKGNTQFNMASNRAERQALSRLRPGEMPMDIEIMDEAVAESISKPGGEVIDSTAQEVPAEETNVEEVIPGDNIPAPEEQQAPATAKDESPVSKETVSNIINLTKQAGMTTADLGTMMSKDLKWKVPSKLSELHVWQGLELIRILNKVIGK